MRATSKYHNRKGIRLRCWPMGAKGRTGVVSLPECIASWEGGTRHLYLCCADSAQLSFREADEEEWPCGRTYWAHLYLSSSCESRAAESAAPPLFPPPFPSPTWMGNDLSALAWHPLCLQAGALTLRSWCATSPADPCRHRLISASVSHVLNTGQHSSSTPALVTVTIFQKEGKTKRWGKIVNNNEKKAKHALILCRTRRVYMNTSSTGWDFSWFEWRRPQRWELAMRKLVVVTDNSRNAAAVVTSTLLFNRARHYPCQAWFISVFLKSKFFNQL